MDMLTLEDFSSKALLATSLSEADIFGLFPQTKECVIEQRTLEVGCQQLLFDYEAGLTDLINKFNDLKDRLESEQSRSQDINDVANTDDMLGEYWAEFRKYCDNQGMLLDPVSWNRHTQYAGFRLSLRNVSERDIWLAAWRDPNHRCIAVNLHLRLGASDAEDGFDGLAIFDVLKENKEDIEEAFGESFTWQRVPNFSTPGPLVGVYENITPDRDDWENQFEWMFTTLEALNQIFRKFVLQSVNTVQLREHLQ